MLIAFIVSVCIALLVCGLSIYVSNNENVYLVFLRSFAPLICLILALVSANLSSSFGGWTIFISLALAINIIIASNSRNNKDKVTPLLLGGAYAVELLCFALAAIVSLPFNIWGILFGLSIGAFVGILSIIFDRKPWLNALIYCINLAFCGLVLGQAITLLISGRLLISSILYLLASLFIFARPIYVNFVKREELTFSVIGQVLEYLPLILLASSIYFA